jgi:hypothetical protein
LVGSQLVLEVVGVGGIKGDAFGFFWLFYSRDKFIRLDAGSAIVFIHRVVYA